MKNISKSIVVPAAMLMPFILITVCFPLWGFANDITNPMVSSFKTILIMPNWQSALIQMAFYGGYFAMAFPAALFIKKYTYKSGILMGLGLYATGALLFIPATLLSVFAPFIIAYFILTCGLSFLETSANPYILSMGPDETATRRLNLAQAFNPLGSLLGMFTARKFILARLDTRTYDERLMMATSDVEKLEEITRADLTIIRNPYVALGIVILIFFIITVFARMPKSDDDHSIHFMESIRRLLKRRRYTEGVIAQFFYVGAQILCWTFIIQYGESMGLTKAQAQDYNIVAMVFFVSSRFIATALMKYIRAGKLLMIFGIGAVTMTFGTILLPGMIGLFSLVGVSAFMSLMFPTIYGIALKGTGDDTKFGAAGLIMAILGGSILPPLQALILDIGGPGYTDITLAGINEVRLSFLIPIFCLAVVVWYGYRTEKVHDLKSV
ncbi:MAG: L-fucose:H+ symporter permease [Bacteroidales bacterium]|nr:MAG: L-fucose:H+ symporter permease [Bacteroidales bacterium]